MVDVDDEVTHLRTPTGQSATVFLVARDETAAVYVEQNGILPFLAFYVVSVEGAILGSGLIVNDVLVDDKLNVFETRASSVVLRRVEKIVDSHESRSCKTHKPTSYLDIRYFNIGFSPCKPYAANLHTMRLRGGTHKEKRAMRSASDV